MEHQATQSVINSDQMDMLIGSAGIDTAKAILDAFWKSNDELLSALTEHVAAGNIAEASASAHALKGSAANLGAIQLSNRARAIEAACRENDVAAAEKVLFHVGRDIAETRQAFDTLLMTKAA